MLSFLPQSKDITKLSVVCEWECVCMWLYPMMGWHTIQGVPCPVPWNRIQVTRHTVYDQWYRKCIDRRSFKYCNRIWSRGCVCITWYRVHRWTLYWSVSSNKLLWQEENERKSTREKLCLWAERRRRRGGRVRIRTALHEEPALYVYRRRAEGALH